LRRSLEGNANHANYPRDLNIPKLEAVASSLGTF
jgi:hypothetical protein